MRPLRCFTTLILTLFLLVTSVCAPFPASAQASTFKGFTTGYENNAQITSNITELANLGSTIVRLPIYLAHPFKPSDPWERDTIEEWIEPINVALAARDAAERRTGRKMILVLNLHTLAKTNRNGTIDRREFVSAWKTLAAEYESKDRIWYDLLNEPQYNGWRDDALRAARAIRRIDTKHKILVAARGITTNRASQISKLPGIRNQALTFHFYNWMNSIQCRKFPPPTESNPECLCPDADRFRYVTTTNRRDRNRSPRNTFKLRQLLREVKQAGERNNVPVYIGEVAIPWKHQDAAAFLKDFTSICDEFGIHLTVHSFRESCAWDYEKSGAVWSVLTGQTGWLSS